MASKILVIDDEKIKRITLQAQLEGDGYDVIIGENAFVGLKALAAHDIDVVITDLRMPSMDGLAFLQEIKKISPNSEVILMTAYGTVESAVRAMKSGAYDYLTKPFSYEELSIKLQRLIEHKQGQATIEALQQKIHAQFRYQNIIGRSKAMRSVFDKLDAVADSDTTVLIQGETGTGKELLANALHYNSARKNAPFIMLSCAILNSELLESELFGHEKGAFTGAMRSKKGRFELANTGTIFLDEIDDISIETQVKLLRVLQERTFERVGGEETLHTDVRVVVATKKDLRKMVNDKLFREDLFYRLNIVKIDLPPLRQRQEDIELLAQHFVKKISHAKGCPEKKLSPEVLRILLQNQWPGNVRELENVIEHAVTLCKSDIIEMVDLPEYLLETQATTGIFSLNIRQPSQIKYIDAMNEASDKLIYWALQKTNGNQAKAASLLHIPRTTLRDKMKS